MLYILSHSYFVIRSKFIQHKNYQTSHLLTGLYVEPTGQFQSEANSFEFEKGPFTLNIPGEWAPVLMRFSRLFGRYFEHQVLAALNQNNCF